jgi:hypothetical protein
MNRYGSDDAEGNRGWQASRSRVSQSRGRGENAHMQWRLFLGILVVPLILQVYSSLRGGGICKDAYQGPSGILAGSPGSRLETLLAKADVYAVVIVIVSALICALSAVVVAVHDDADAPLVCWLIAISGLLCRSALPVESLNSSRLG